jgi:hypothetical protein
VLARLRQSPVPTSFADWKVYQVFPPFEADYGPACRAPDRRLLAYLAHGRPLLGHAPSDEQGYYAYLDAGEVVHLADALQRLQSRHDELRGNAYHDGFVDALLAALRELSRGGHDLWFDAG